MVLRWACLRTPTVTVIIFIMRRTVLASATLIGSLLTSGMVGVAPTASGATGPSPSVERTIAFLRSGDPTSFEQCQSLSSGSGSGQAAIGVDLCQGNALVHRTYPTAAFARYFQQWGRDEIRYADALRVNALHPHRYSPTALDNLESAFVAYAQNEFSFVERWIVSTPYVLEHLNAFPPTRYGGTTFSSVSFEMAKRSIFCAITTNWHGTRVAATSNVYCESFAAGRTVTLLSAGAPQIGTGLSNVPVGTPVLPSSGILNNGDVRCTLSSSSVRCTNLQGHGFIATATTIRAFAPK